MSRTVRRKNEKWMEWNFVDAWFTNTEHGGSVEHSSIFKLGYGRAWWHFHGDKRRFGMRKETRRPYNRKFRHDSKHAVNHALQTMTEDQTFSCFKKCNKWWKLY